MAYSELRKGNVVYFASQGNCPEVSAGSLIAFQARLLTDHMMERSRNLPYVSMDLVYPSESITELPEGKTHVEVFTPEDMLYMLHRHASKIVKERSPEKLAIPELPVQAAMGLDGLVRNPLGNFLLASYIHAEADQWSEFARRMW